MAVYNTTTPEATEALGERLAQHLRPGAIVAFTGGLGAGKTTFCRGLARGLGCTGHVSSPTYAIVNVYPGRVTLAHFDLYRLETEQDLEAAGFYEYLDEGAVLALEWSEKLPLPEGPNVRVDMRETADGGRQITVEGAEGL